MTEQRTDIDDHGRLLVYGADRPGIVSAVSSLLSDLGANIISLDQHSTDPEGGRFYQRTEFHLPALSTQIDDLEKLADERLGHELGLSWRVVEAKRPKRVAILASKVDHCLLDLLWRQRRRDLAMQITMVISNHPDLSDDVRQFGVPFVHVPVPKDGKAQAEYRQLELLHGNVDVIVLARYMQVLSGNFLDAVDAPLINIHHSFLPAFSGASPYQKAKERGVKLIGATAHYVTEQLDEGPIIEQEVVRVTHKDTAHDLVRRGADVERQVLARAVAWHCDDRVLCDEGTTVVFQ